MKRDQNPADVLNEGRAALAERLVDALAAAIDEDVRVADDQVKALKSPAVKRLRKDAETVDDRFEAVSKQAEDAQRLARAERKEIRRLRTQLKKDLERLAIAPIQERGNGRRTT